MKKYFNQKTFNLLVTVLLVVGGYFGFVAPEVQPMGGNWSGAITAENVTATSTMTSADIAATDDLTVGDDAAITGLATVGETLGVTGIATFGSDVIVDDVFNTDETAYTSVGAQTLVPTTTFYELAPVSVLTLTLSTALATEGDFLILASTVATDTTIVDTTCTVGGSTITLGSAGDMAVFLYTNSLWCEIASPDNS